MVTRDETAKEVKKDSPEREKIAHLKLAYDAGITVDGVPMYLKCEAIGLDELEQALEFADQILAILPEGKPPLIEIPFVSDFVEEDAGAYIQGYGDGATAQLELCKKFYTGSV